MRKQNSWVTAESYPLFHQETNLRAALTSANFCKVSETEKSHFICVTPAFSLQQKRTTHLICLLGKTLHFLQIIQAVSDGLLNAIHIVWVSFRKLIICT